MQVSLLHQLLDQAASRFAAEQAITLDGRSLTYEQLTCASMKAAAWLRRQGVRRGDRVVLAAPPRAVSVPLIYGCSRLGAVFVILHEQVRGQGLVHVLDDAQPRLLITDDEAGRQQAANRNIDTLATGDAAMSIDRCAARPDAGDEGTGPLPVDPACFIYTSGSTGMPKAVVSTHSQMVFAAQAIQSQLRYCAADVVFAAPPLSFDYGLYQVFLAAQAGAHVWLATAADVGPSLVRNLRQSGATILPALPSLADNLARMLDRYGGTLPLRLLTNTGAAMQEQTLARLRSHIPGLRVQLMFGLTECKRVSIMPPDEDLRRPGACGRALPGTEIMVIDDEKRPLPPGEPGEIVVRGPHVMAGYWRRPELTSKRFPRRDGLFPELHTGDYGWLDADGYLYFSGRRDDIYKSRGFRVSGTEIESAAARLADVEAAALVPPGPGRAQPVLFVVTAMLADEVLARLRMQIEPYKVPDRCLVIQEMPLTGNGKVDRTALLSALLTVSQEPEEDPALPADGHVVRLSATPGPGYGALAYSGAPASAAAGSRIARAAVLTEASTPIAALAAATTPTGSHGRYGGKFPAAPASTMRCTAMRARPATSAATVPMAALTADSAAASRRTWDRVAPASRNARNSKRRPELAIAIALATAITE
ncbi:MAG: acyl--CoA ligase [Streptosporangiaceae bacterium]|nr:acyl--CoA ligase [Streptosporangiaceae bacterium]